MAGPLTGAGAVEPTRSVVEQGRVGEAKRRGHRGVALVAGRTDRVEAVPLGPEPAGAVVEDPAVDLGLEDLVERNVAAVVGATCPSRVGRECSDRIEQRRFEFVQVVGSSSHRPKA